VNSKSARRIKQRGGMLVLTLSERLNFAGGIPLYEKECREVLNNGFKGFETEAPTATA